MFWAQLFALVPGLPGVFVRRAFYRLTLERCTGSFFVGFGAFFSHRGSIVEDAVYVGPYAIVGSSRLRRGCLIGSRAGIISGTGLHELTADGLRTPTDNSRLRQVEIGEYAWIGEGALVMADVGRSAMVAAGSVVSSPVIGRRRRRRQSRAVRAAPHRSTGRSPRVPPVPRSDVRRLDEGDRHHADRLRTRRARDDRAVDAADLPQAVRRRVLSLCHRLHAGARAAGAGERCCQAALSGLSVRRWRMAALMTADRARVWYRPRAEQLLAVPRRRQRGLRQLSGESRRRGTSGTYPPRPAAVGALPAARPHHGWRWSLAALAIEIPVRTMLIAWAGPYVAYMLLTNWIAVFLAGLAWGARPERQPQRIVLTVLRGARRRSDAWALTMRAVGFTPTFPFMTIDRLAVAGQAPWPFLPRCRSCICLQPCCTFGAMRRLTAPGPVRFLARNSLIIVLVHMPVFYRAQSGA